MNEFKKFVTTLSKVRYPAYDENDALKAKLEGEPYTADEWLAYAQELTEKVADAVRRFKYASENGGVCRADLPLDDPDLPDLAA